MNIYWSKIEQRHRFEHIMAELAIPVNAEDSFLGVAADLRGVLADINSIAERLRHCDRALYKDLLNLLQRLGLPPSCLDDHPDHHWCFGVRNWEVLNIGFENVLKKANLKLTQLELKYLEEYLKIHHTDLEARDRMKILQKEFEKLATTAIYVD